MSTPTPRRFFVHTGESYDASYTSEAEARAAAEHALDGWRDNARDEDGWADEAASVAWGEVREIATAIEHAGSVGEDGLDDDGVDYELRAPFTDPALDAAILTTPEVYVGRVSEAVAEELERVKAERDSARATERARTERILRALADAHRALHGGGGEYCHALATALDFINQDERSES